MEEPQAWAPPETHSRKNEGDLHVLEIIFPGPSTPDALEKTH
jgi:hypothetical protein